MITFKYYHGSEQTFEFEFKLGDIEYLRYFIIKVKKILENREFKFDLVENREGVRYDVYFFSFILKYFDDPKYKNKLMQFYDTLYNLMETEITYIITINENQTVELVDDNILDPTKDTWTDKEYEKITEMVMVSSDPLNLFIGSIYSHKNTIILLKIVKYVMMYDLIYFIKYIQYIENIQYDDIKDLIIINGNVMKYNRLTGFRTQNSHIVRLAIQTNNESFIWSLNNVRLDRDPEDANSYNILKYIEYIFNGKKNIFILDSSKVITDIEELIRNPQLLYDLIYGRLSYDINMNELIEKLKNVFLNKMIIGENHRIFSENSETRLSLLDPTQKPNKREPRTPQPSLYAPEHSRANKAYTTRPLASMTRLPSEEPKTDIYSTPKSKPRRRVKIPAP